MKCHHTADWGVFALVAALAAAIPEFASPTWATVSTDVAVRPYDADTRESYVADEQMPPLQFAAGTGVLVVMLLVLIAAIHSWQSGVQWRWRRIGYCTLAVGYSVAIAYFGAYMLKFLTRVPRPDFEARCEVNSLNVPLVAADGRRDDVAVGLLCCPTKTPENAVAVEKCRDLVLEGLLNFPSAHATVAAATVTISFLLSTEVAAGAAAAGAYYVGLLLVNSILLLYCVFATMTRVADHRHDWTAVFAGAILGAALADGVYRLFYVPRTRCTEPQLKPRSRKKGGDV